MTATKRSAKRHEHFNMNWTLVPCREEKGKEFRNVIQGIVWSAAAETGKIAGY
jgi:hypothetical protein